jgi:hypothetical protein
MRPFPLHVRQLPVWVLAFEFDDSPKKKKNPLADSLSMPLSNTSFSANCLYKSLSDRQHFGWRLAISWPMDI